MSKYRKQFFAFLAFLQLFLGCYCCAQQEETKFVLQQGHGGTIDKIRISPNKRFFATSGQDGKIVVWEYNSGRQVIAKQLNKKIKELAFSPNGDSLYFMTNTSVWQYALAISDTSISIRVKESLISVNRQEVTFNDKRIDLILSTINLYQLPSNKRIKQQTCDYFEDPFLNIVYCSKNKYVYAGCKDGSVYVFDEQLNRVRQLKGHIGAVTDLELSPDERVLFSVSEDRSIIRWNLDNHSIIGRSVGYNFPLVSAAVQESKELQLIFGDESGNVSHLGMTPFSIKMNRHNMGYKAISQLGFFSDTLFYAGGEGRKLKFFRTEQKSEQLFDETNPLQAFSIAFQGLTGAVDFIYEDLFGYYRKPLATLNHISLSPNKQWLATTNTLSIPTIRFYHNDGEKITRSRRLFHLHRLLGVLDNPKFLCHFTALNDSTFVSASTGNPFSFLDTNSSFSFWNINDKNSALYFWRIQNGNLKKVLFNEVDFKDEITGLHAFSDSILVYEKQDSLGMYHVYSGQKNTFSSRHIRIVSVAQQKALVQYPDFSFRLLSDRGVFSSAMHGHFDTIQDAALLPNHHQLITVSKDGTLRFWDTDSLDLIATLIPTGNSNFVIITPDNYYYLSSRKVSSFGFKKGEEFFLPEQFDALYNRPDIVLERLGFMDTSVLRMYREAYHKRMKKLGYNEELLRGDFHLPSAHLLQADSIPPVVSSPYLDLSIVANDNKYLLDHLNVWINEVPVFGKSGIDLKHLQSHNWSDDIQLELATGDNKIQVSVHNQAGAESFRETIYVNYTPAKTQKPDLYLVAIGVSHYSNNLYDLKYAAKDAQDIANYFSSSTALFDSIHQVVLTDQLVTVTQIEATKKLLQQSKRDDVVLISYAGHGLLDAGYNYFLATHNMDFDSPATNGLSYEALEDLLDGIKPLRKALFIDACHSGELDKESIASTAVSANGVQSKPVGRGVIIDLQSNPYQAQTSTLAKELFADLRRGNGATVISASGGMEFAMESQNWKNGLFTYCLLNGLRSMEADSDKNKEIRLSELQVFLEEEVARLSGGKQKPTSRRENLSLDFRLK